MHILWECSFARNIWVEGSKWLDVKLQCCYFGSIEDCFRLGANSLKSEGSICIAAILWTLWTSRNDLIFKGIKDSIQQVIAKIKLRSFCWAKIANMASEHFSNLWQVSPIDSMKMHRRHRLHRLLENWFCRVDYIGFVDGSWVESNNSSTAGIGGFLIDKNRAVKIIFSGPTQQASVFDTELEALFYLLKLYYSSRLKNYSLAIFLDSQKLIQYMLASKRDFTGPIMEWLQGVSKVFIESFLNSSADRLASEGRSRKSMIFSWVF